MAFAKNKDSVAVKKTQLITIWIFMMIVIAGLFYPLLGYLVIVVMVSCFAMAYFKSRYWCKNLCPRGAFLDFIVSRLGLNLFSLPKFFSAAWFRYLVLVLSAVSLAWKITHSHNDAVAFGRQLISYYIRATAIAILLGVIYDERAWCKMCPEGLAQSKIARIKHSKEESEL